MCCWSLSCTTCGRCMRCGGDRGRAHARRVRAARVGLDRSRRTRTLRTHVDAAAVAASWKRDTEHAHASTCDGSSQDQRTHHSISPFQSYISSAAIYRAPPMYVSVSVPTGFIHQQSYALIVTCFNFNALIL